MAPRLARLIARPAIPAIQLQKSTLTNHVAMRPRGAATMATSSKIWYFRRVLIGPVRKHSGLDRRDGVVSGKTATAAVETVHAETLLVCLPDSRRQTTLARGTGRFDSLRHAFAPRATIALLVHKNIVSGPTPRNFCRDIHWYSRLQCSIQSYMSGLVRQTT